MFPNGDRRAVVNGVAELCQRHVKLVHLRKFLARFPFAFDAGLLFLNAPLHVAYEYDGRKRKRGWWVGKGKRKGEDGRGGRGERVKKGKRKNRKDGKERRGRE